MNVIIIPARAGSTRFPNKPLAFISGKPMLGHVLDRAQDSKKAGRIIVATESDVIKRFVSKLGHECVMTEPHFRSGTERVAQVVKELNLSSNTILSLQGDVPLLPPWVIDSLFDAGATETECEVLTAMTRIEGDSLVSFVRSKLEGSSTGTCVSFTKSMKALYFSSSLIPFKPSLVYRHLGVYCFRPGTLQKLASLKAGYFGESEKLEQNVWLENEWEIRLVEVDFMGREHVSVDSPEDIALVEAVIQKEGYPSYEKCEN